MVITHSKAAPLSWLACHGCSGCTCFHPQGSYSVPSRVVGRLLILRVVRFDGVGGIKRDPRGCETVELERSNPPLFLPLFPRVDQMSSTRRIRREPGARAFGLSR